MMRLPPHILNTSCRQYYKLTPTFQGTGNGTGSGALQQAASPKGEQHEQPCSLNF